MALNIPKHIQAGDTLRFTDQAANYPAPTWTITYALYNGETSITFSSSANGSEHDFNVAHATTTKWHSGEYRYQATASDGTDKFTIGTGVVKVLPDLSSGLDGQLTHVERTLATLEKTIESLVSKEHSTMQFNGRSYTVREVGDLLVLRDKYKAELVSIRAAERVAAGMASGRKIKVRF